MSTDEQPSAPATPPDQNSGSLPFLSEAEREEEFYELDDENESGGDNEDPFALGRAAPFQVSGGLPVVNAGKTTAFTPPSQVNTSTRHPQRRRFRYLLIALASVAVVLILTLALTANAAPAAPPARTNTHPSSAPTVLVQPTKKPNQAPSPTPSTASSWVPQQLPNGWTAAGLTVPDAVFAERTALTFNDREEGLDYRNVGTQANHGGTMTAALFILTPAGQARFQQNDVRAINNTLFNQVEQEKLVQAAVNVTPTLVQFQVVGQQQFAWVTVSFYLWQSHIDPNTQQRVNGLDTDPATKQPRVHQMSVLLLRVPYNDQGNNPAMGGSGWLVSTYALDNGLPAIVQPA